MYAGSYTWCVWQLPFWCVFEGAGLVCGLAADLLAGVSTQIFQCEWVLSPLSGESTHL